MGTRVYALVRSASKRVGNDDAVVTDCGSELWFHWLIICIYTYVCGLCFCWPCLNMIIALVNVVSDMLFAALDPRHLGNLRLVNKELAKLIDAGEQERCVEAASAKYESMVVVEEAVVRVFSRLGKHTIDLILPLSTSEMDTAHFPIFMWFNSQLYRGLADVYWFSNEMNPDDLTRYVFHNRSSRLYGAAKVFILNYGTDLENPREKTIELFVEEVKGTYVGWDFTLKFQPCGPMRKMVGV